jgi:hypothetical protein
VARQKYTDDSQELLPPSSGYKYQECKRREQVPPKQREVSTRLNGVTPHILTFINALSIQPIVTELSLVAMLTDGLKMPNTQKYKRDIYYKVHTPTNALFIKLDKVLKFTLKITLSCSHMFRPTTIIREPSLQPS